MLTEYDDKFITEIQHILSFRNHLNSTFCLDDYKITNST